MRTSTERFDNVVNLYGRPERMKNPLLAGLLAHWQELRQGRIAPERSEVDPNAISDVLAHAFILEPMQDGAPRIRIAGMALCDLLGMELRGMPATALFSDSARPEFLRLCGGMFDHPTVTEVTLSAAGHDIPADLLMLPLADAEGRIARILGALVCEAIGLQPPTRFEILHSNLHAIHAAAEELPQGMAEPAAAFGHAPRARGGNGPRLTLIDCSELEGRG